MKKSRQISQYDKILKENLEAFLPTLITKILGIDVVEMVELPDDLHHTKERKPDALKKITLTDSSQVILQIEFQLADDSMMIYRMMEYYVMLRRTYNLPVRQVVVFLGDRHSRMETNYQSERMTFYYELMSFSNFDFQVFIDSGKPEEIILAILANNQSISSVDLVARIIKKVEETSTSHLAFNKYLQQLRILANLRRFNLKFEELMESILKYINQEEDILFKRGKAQGIEKGIEKGIEQGIEQGMTLKELEKNRIFVTNLLQKSNFSFQQIAEIAVVDISFVEKIALELSK